MAGATIPADAGTKKTYLDAAAAWRCVMQLRQRPQADVFAYIEPLGVNGGKTTITDQTHWRLCVVPGDVLKGGLTAQDVDRKAVHIHNVQQFDQYLSTLDGGGSTSQAVVGDTQAGQSGGYANTP